MAGAFLPLLALVAGVVSFSSPCCLPLLPGYVSYVTGLPVAGLARADARAVTLQAAVAFVAGFTTVFSLLGISAGLLGSFVLRNLPVIVRISGAFVIVMGLAMAGVMRVPILFRQARFDPARLPAGPGGAFPVGMAFAAGWTPCIGPVLATILTAAAATRTAAWGGILLVLYSLGLGLPFIGLALGLNRAKGSLSWLRRHGRAVEVFGGVVLVGVGVAFVTGVWHSLFVPLQTYFARLGWPPI